MKGFMYLLASIIFLILVFAGIQQTIEHPSIENVVFEIVAVGLVSLSLWLYIRVNRKVPDENGNGYQ